MASAPQNEPAGVIPASIQIPVAEGGLIAIVSLEYSRSDQMPALDDVIERLVEDPVVGELAMRGG